MTGLRIGTALLLLAVGGALSSCSPVEDQSAATVAGSSSHEAAPGFTPTLDRRSGHLADGTTWKVGLPQVSGGDRQVRAAFNGYLDAILVTLTGQPSGNGMTIEDSKLGSAEHSRTVIGASTLSGVVIVMGYAKGAAHPNIDVETAVVNSRTGELIAEPFTDPQTATKTLAELAAAGDQTGRLRGGASYSSFTSWIPLPEGLHIYVAVPHVLGDYVPVTIPWDKAAGLLKPDVRAVLVG